MVVGTKKMWSGSGESDGMDVHPPVVFQLVHQQDCLPLFLLARNVLPCFVQSTVQKAQQSKKHVNECSHPVFSTGLFITLCITSPFGAATPVTVLFATVLDGSFPGEHNADLESERLPS